MTEPGWHPDPMGRNEQRFWDGANWTHRVANQGVSSIEPAVGPQLSLPAPPDSQRPPPPPAETSPRSYGGNRVGVTVVSVLLVVGILLVAAVVVTSRIGHKGSVGASSADGPASTTTTDEVAIPRQRTLPPLSLTTDLCSVFGADDFSAATHQEATQSKLFNRAATERIRYSSCRYLSAFGDELGELSAGGHEVPIVSLSDFSRWHSSTQTYSGSTSEPLPIAPVEGHPTGATLNTTGDDSTVEVAIWFDDRLLSLEMNVLKPASDQAEASAQKLRMTLVKILDAYAAN